jgi:hypothetical protein
MIIKLKMRTNIIIFQFYQVIHNAKKKLKKVSKAKNFHTKFFLTIIFSKNPFPT